MGGGASGVGGGEWGMGSLMLGVPDAPIPVCWDSAENDLHRPDVPKQLQPWHDRASSAAPGTELEGGPKS